MNVSFTFRGGDEALEKKFSVEAQWVKFFTLGGHRSVDGCRASLYNGLPLEGVEALCSFMKSFLDAGFIGDDTSRAACFGRALVHGWFAEVINIPVVVQRLIPTVLLPSRPW